LPPAVVVPDHRVCDVDRLPRLMVASQPCGRSISGPPRVSVESSTRGVTVIATDVVQ
jgi:hypothetical protein